jgi:hypothetical protein
MLKARNIPAQKPAALAEQRVISFSFQIPPVIKIAVQQHVALDRPAFQPMLACERGIAQCGSRLKTKLHASTPRLPASNHGHPGNFPFCHEK